MTPEGRGSIRRWIILIGLGLALGSGCAIKPFNVKPRPTAPPGGFAARATEGSLEVKAGTIRDEDYLYTTFDANLVLAGVLPLKLEIRNGGSQPVNMKQAQFMLSNGQKPIGPRHAFKRLMTYYKIRLYSPEGYKASLGDFMSYGLDQASLLPPGESRWGILFFQDRPDQPRGRGLILSVKGLGPAELKMAVD